MLVYTHPPWCGRDLLTRTIEARYYTHFPLDCKKNSVSERGLALRFAYGAKRPSTLIIPGISRNAGNGWGLGAALPDYFFFFGGLATLFFKGFCFLFLDAGTGGSIG